MAAGSWYWTLRWIIGFLTIVGNAIVIFLIARCRRLWIPPNMYILSLAAADLLVGLFVIPFTCACTFGYDCDWALAKNFYNLLFYLSVSNLCLMTADRYCAVVHPFRYVASCTTPGKVARFIALAWLIPMLLSLVTLLWRNASMEAKKEAEMYYRVARVSILEVLPCTVISVAYLRIFQIARRHARQISHERARALSVLSNVGGGSSVDGVPSSNQATLSRSTSSGVKATATVAGIFVFSWIVSAGRSFCELTHLCPVPQTLLVVSRLLMLSNSAVNPMIYALMKKDIENEMKDSFQCIWRKFGRGQVASSERTGPRELVVT